MRNYTKNKKNKSRLLQLLVGVIALFLLSTSAKAQLTDTSGNKTRIITPFVSKDIVVKPKFHSPKKAALLSAVIPGAGQIYNKKYWKLPIIYAGFAGLTYSFQLNQTRYKSYRIDYINSLDGKYDGQYSSDQLLTLTHYYHRYRDLSVIGAALLYVLNIVDASVDAHMFTFNVSDDLSFNVHPTLINTVDVMHYTSGIGLIVKF
jgi:hypothetical protein